MNELVSVIIPCYNGEKFIARSVRSVAEQDYPRIELIVVNDGSTDRTAEILRELKREFDGEGRELICLYQENAGLGGAVNAGLKSVHGAFLTLLDADDRFLPGSISARAAFLRDRRDCTGVRSNGWHVFGENRYLFVTDETEKAKEDILPLLMEGTTNNWSGSYMLRTDVLFSHYPDREIYPSRFGQNLQLLCPCAFSGKIGFLDIPLTEYIHRPCSLSSAENTGEAKKKELINADGYHDIRLKVISHLFGSLSGNEARRFITLADRSLYRQRMHIAIGSGDRALLKESYQSLRGCGASLNDRIDYYHTACRPLSLPLRALRKLLTRCGRGASC